MDAKKRDESAKGGWSHGGRVATLGIIPYTKTIRSKNQRRRREPYVAADGNRR